MSLDAHISRAGYANDALLRRAAYETGGYEWIQPIKQ